MDIFVTGKRKRCDSSAPIHQKCIMVTILELLSMMLNMQLTAKRGKGGLNVVGHRASRNPGVEILSGEFIFVTFVPSLYCVDRKVHGVRCR